MPTLAEEFAAAVRRHDLTYHYSDDHSVWRAGEASLERIRALAAQLPREEAARIWNQIVDEKISEGYREHFYWK